jgi:hypothetical protein
MSMVSIPPVTAKFVAVVETGAIDGPKQWGAEL